ncbi:MAG TPA: CbtA family protein [Solirubrobacteraceae bacterium]
MLRNLLLCGLVAGLCAGLVGTGFASLAGEPAIDGAIAYEDAHAASSAPAGHDHAAAVAPVPVSRALQKSAGLLTALVVDGVALGGIFALVFAFAYGRLGQASPRATACWLAAAAFVVLFLVPFVKYPATPPAVGDPDTIDRRTALYATMFAISVLGAIAAARLRPVLRERLDGHAATGLAVLAYLAVAIAAGLALPGIHEVPADFPATTLWRFREASVGLQVTMWATIGTLFGFAAQRVMTGRPVLARRADVRVAGAD